MNKTNRVINLGLIQWSDPFDRKAMSGTPYKMAEALRAVGLNVVWVPAKKTLALRMYTKAVNLLNKFCLSLDLVDSQRRVNNGKLHCSA